MSSLDSNAPPVRRRSRMQRARWPVMIAVVVVALVIGLVAYLTGGRYESTDDAQVGGARVSIAASISGRVVEIDVRDNQQVRAGDVLFRLDAKPIETSMNEAQANLAASRLQVEQPPRRPTISAWRT